MIYLTKLARRFLIIILLILMWPTSPLAQCCGAGGGSPIATDISQSVLLPRQFEISANYQHISTTRFLTGSMPENNYLDRYSSNYNYFRVAYGVTEAFTMSVETGYWLDKTQVGLNQSDTLRSGGFGDLILFPKLNLYKKNLTEVTAGLGIKIPVGSYNDSVGLYEPFSGQTIYLVMPPAVQPTSGSNDFIFNIFVAKSFPVKRWRFFANAMYILNGWNPNGEHYGDYASLGLFAGYSFSKKLRGLIQVKGEWIDQMEINPVIRSFTFPSFDPDATGSKKVFIAPQVNFSTGNGLNFYIMSEIPVYQYVNKTQIASMLKLSGGLSFRFKLPEKKKPMLVAVTEE